MDSRLLPFAPTAERVLEDVVEVTNVSPRAIVGPAKSPHIIHARRAWWWLVRELSGASYPAIARVAERDHATIMYGIRRALTTPARDVILAVIAHATQAWPPGYELVVERNERWTSYGWRSPDGFARGWASHLSARRSAWEDFEVRHAA